MVHPLVTEPVDYVSQRTELMMATFFLLTIYLGGSAVAGHRNHGRTRPTVSVICCALGMACKETMVVAPIVVLLYDRTFAFRNRHTAWRGPRLVGVAYSFQQVPSIAREPHDVHLDAVVTEAGVIRCSTG